MKEIAPHIVSHGISLTSYLGSLELEAEVARVARLVEARPWRRLGGGLGPGSWLDLAWTRPLELDHEFVPASDLGVWVVLAGGRAIVTSVQVRRGR